MTGISEDELCAAFRSLGIPLAAPVLAHTSLSAFGEVSGGAEAVVEALLAVFSPLVMPAFTYLTMVIPESGPGENGIAYGSGKTLNRLARIYTPALPVDRMIGRVAEAFRRHPETERSAHPIFSFAGRGAAHLLAAQTLAEPFAPLGQMAAQGGWVLLLGVDHTTNTTIHYAEQLAGQKTFLRWALTPAGVRPCPNYPGCSDGFEALAPYLRTITRSARVGKARLQALPMAALIATVREIIEHNPRALLCARQDCERCCAIRMANR